MDFSIQRFKFDYTRTIQQLFVQMKKECEEKTIEIFLHTLAKLVNIILSQPFLFVPHFRGLI
jgi:hypothetical protein